MIHQHTADFGWRRDVEAHSRALVAWPSVHGTAGETTFAPLLHKHLAQRDYFRTHPDHIELQRTEDDPHERYSVLALAQGNGTQTVALVGHYDTVAMDDYGALQALALQPDALREALLAGQISDLARRDLASGDFLPGRGMLDMKSGLAVGIAVLERFTAQAPAGRIGNVLFIATPDEEATSLGIRTFMRHLPDWLAARELELSAIINLDAMNDQGDGTDGQIAFLGSVGKVLATAWCIGHPAHAGFPFDGISGAFIAACFARQVDYNPALSDGALGEWAPPPVVLRMQDGGKHYAAVTPATAHCAVNVLTCSRSPQQILSDLGEAARVALDDAVMLWRERAAQVDLPSSKQWQPRVLTVAELRAFALKHSPAQFAAKVEVADQRAATLTSADAFDWLEADRTMTETLWTLSGLDGPAIVLGVARPFYPRTMQDAADPGKVRLVEAIQRRAAELHAERGVNIGLRNFYTISDMSFLAPSVALEDVAFLAANAPTDSTRQAVTAGLAEARQLRAPVVNLGPWGRDYHQPTERVHVPYSFDVLPELIWRVVIDILK